MSLKRSTCPYHAKHWAVLPVKFQRELSGRRLQLSENVHAKSSNALSHSNSVSEQRDRLQRCTSACTVARSGALCASAAEEAQPHTESQSTESLLSVRGHTLRRSACPLSMRSSVGSGTPTRTAHPQSPHTLLLPTHICCTHRVVHDSCQLPA